MREEWRRFAAFLKAPTLPDAAPRLSPGALIGMVRMLGLDMLLMLGLVAVAAIVVAVGIELPETALASMDITFQLAFAVIVVAPVAEELLFRGWLSGRPSRVVGLIVLLGGIAIGTAMTATGPQSDVPGPALLVYALSIVFALTAFLALRGRDVPRWFRRAFPALFWLSTLAFAFIHVFNFEGAALMAALPLVLPQFITGSILGYVRVRYTLWAAMLMHMLHNSAALSLAYIATEAAV